MARLPRTCPPGVPQHVIQRGNNRQACFVVERDYGAYANWLHEAAQRYGVAIHAWVFMTNHVHLLVTPQAPQALSRMMQTVGRRYVRYFNIAHQRTGTLWEGRFKSCSVEAEDYLLACQRYIELNPVRAGMVSEPGDYPWSSYRANALGAAAKLWTPHDLYLRLGRTHQARRDAYQHLFGAFLGEQLVGEIRTAVNKGLALGGHRFKRDLELLTGRRMVSWKPGPKPAFKGGGDA